MTARLSECFPASGQMCLHKVPLLWIRYEVWLQEWNGKCFCPEVKAPQTQPGIPLKQLTVGLYTCGCRFSCGAVLPGQSDKRLVWAEEITKFAEMYKVSANELLYGFADEFPEIEFEAFLGNSEIRMINYSLLYDRLNDKDKDKVMKYIVSLLEQQN